MFTKESTLKRQLFPKREMCMLCCEFPKNNTDMAGLFLCGEPIHNFGLFTNRIEGYSLLDNDKRLIVLRPKRYMRNDTVEIMGMKSWLYVRCIVDKELADGETNERIKETNEILDKLEQNKFINCEYIISQDDWMGSDVFKLTFYI